MFIHRNRYSVLSKAIAIVLVCLFIANDSIFAISATSSESSRSVLAPPLFTNPPCEIIQKPDGSFDVVTHYDVINFWNKETVKHYGRGPVKSSHERWAFVDVSYLIGQMLILAQEHKLLNPKDILIPLIKKHISNRDGEAEILLEGYDIDGIEEVREGGEITGFSLPIIRNDGRAYKLIYNLQGSGTSIPMKDGTAVYIKVETVVCSDTIEKKDVVTTLQTESDNDKYRKQFIGENRAWLKELGFTESGLANVRIKPDTVNLAQFGFRRRGAAQLPLIMNECRKLIRQKLKEQTKHYEFYIYSAGLGEEPDEAVEFVRAFCDVLKEECGDGVRDWDIYVVGLDANDSPVQNSNKIFEQEEKELRRKGFKVSMRAICADVKNRHTLLIIRDGIGETKRADIILNRHTHYGNYMMGDDKEKFRLNDMEKIFDVYMQIRSLIDVFGKEGGLYITEETKEQDPEKETICRHLIIPGTEVIAKNNFLGTGIYRIINPHTNLPVNEFINRLNIELNPMLTEETIKDHGITIDAHLERIHTTNLQATPENIATEQKIDKSSIADIFPQNDYLSYLIMYMTGGTAIAYDAESKDVGEKMRSLHQRLQKGIENFIRMYKSSSGDVRSCYLWFTQFIKENLGAAKELALLVRYPDHKRIIAEGIPNAENFVNGIEMLFDESMKEVDINDTLEKILNLTFAQYYRVREYKYVINKQFSSDMSTISARQDDMAYLLFSLVLPLRAMEEVALTVSTRLISDKGRKYITVTIETPQEISLKNVIEKGVLEEGKDTGVGFELAKRIAQKYGGTIDVQSAPGKGLPTEANPDHTHALAKAGTTFTIRLPIAANLPSVDRDDRTSASGGGVTYGEFAQAPWYKEVNTFLVKIAGVKPGERVLDVGAGTGVSTTILLKAMDYKGEIIALDPNSEYLKIAAESLKGSPVRFVSGRAEEAKDRIKDMAPVDCAFMMNVMHLVDDPKKAFSDIHELLIPNGVLALNTAFFSENSSDILRMLKHVLPILARKAKQAGMANDIFAGRKPMTLRSIEEYVKLLQDAGFDIVEIKRKPVKMDFDDLEYFYRDTAVTSYVAPSLRKEEREALIMPSLHEVLEEFRSKGRSYIEREWLNIVARKKTIASEQKIDKNSIADIFPGSDYLEYLKFDMSGGLFIPNKESEDVGKKMASLRKRLNDGLNKFVRMKKASSNEVKSCYLWFGQVIRANLKTAKQLLSLLRYDYHRKIMEKSVPDAENFVNGIGMLFDESMKDVDINDTLEKILSLTFAQYYKVREYKYVINKHFSYDMPTISARQDDIAYLFFSLVLPFRAMREVALTASTQLISDKGREYITLTIETPQEISLKNVIEEGKDTGVGFELAKRIAQKYGGTIDVRSPSAELGTGEPGKGLPAKAEGKSTSAKAGTTFTVRLPIADMLEETLKALEATGGKKTEAAIMLGISPGAMSGRIKRIRASLVKNGGTTKLERLDKALIKLPSYTEETLKALEESSGNKAKAGLKLGISREAMRLRIKTIREVGDPATLKRLDEAEASFKEATLKALEKSGTQKEAASILGITQSTLSFRKKKIIKIAIEKGDIITIERVNKARASSLEKTLKAHAVEPGQDIKHRTVGAEAFSKRADRIKQRLADWHDEYMKLITEARQKWLKVYPDYLGQKIIRMSLCLPKDTLRKLDKVNMDMVANPEEGKVTIIKGDDSCEASLGNPIDVRDFTRAEKIALLASLPRLPPGEKSMESPEARIRRCFSWWREGLEGFELLTDWSSEVTAEVSAEQLEAASMYLSQEDGMIYVKQFVTNPGFRLTGIGSRFLRRALRELMTNEAVQPRAIRFDYLAEGAREFLEYLERTGFIVGPLVDKEGEYWFLGKEVTGQDIALTYDPLTEKNSFLKASEKFLQSMAPPAKDKTLEKAFDCVREAVETTMQAVDISQYCLYIPSVDEFGEYKFQEEAPKEGELPHIQWVAPSVNGAALRSRHSVPRPLTGEKWIFERLARGELTADEINALTGDLVAHFDSSLGIWHIRNRRALIDLLLEKEGFKGSMTEEEIAIIKSDDSQIGPVTNTITYQAVYAPTLKEKDNPRLLGILWFMGEPSAFQADAVKSFVHQAEYALERMYLLHSLEARRRERESADVRLSQMKRLVSNMEDLGRTFHDLKGEMISTGASYKLLLNRGKITRPDAARERTTIERRVASVMITLKDIQSAVIKLQGHLPPAVRSRSTLNLSNVNLAAALIQVNDKLQLDNVSGYYLGAARPTFEDLTLMQASLESIRSLSELRALTGNLENVYNQTSHLSGDMIVHLQAILPDVQRYAELPLDEIDKLSLSPDEDDDIREFANNILKVVIKIPDEIKRLNNILEGVAAVEEFKEVSLQQLVAKALDEIRSEYMMQDIILETGLSPTAEPIRILTKPHALKSIVITELIRNAIRCMPAGNEVKKIKIWTELEQKNVLLYIQDTGRGMPEEFIRTQLFELGAREDLTGEDGGSGVGLHSARQLMRDLGGDLYVDMSGTAVGKGSTFVIKHPLLPAAPAAPEIPPVPAAITPESERIHATDFKDMLTYIQAQPQSQPLIVALGTSWIKGYERNDDRSFIHLQGKDLNELIISMRNSCESKGIPFIDSEDDKLLARINAEKAKQGMSGAKVVVLAGESTVKSGDFADLRNDEKNAFVVGVNSQELTADSYIRLMEMLTLVLKLSIGLEISQDATPIKIMKDDNLHIYILIPPAQPMHYEEQKAIYKVQQFA